MAIMKKLSLRGKGNVDSNENPTVDYMMYKILINDITE